MSQMIIHVDFLFKLPDTTGFDTVLPQKLEAGQDVYKENLQVREFNLGRIWLIKGEIIKLD